MGDGEVQINLFSGDVYQFTIPVDPQFTLMEFFPFFIGQRIACDDVALLVGSFLMGRVYLVVIVQEFHFIIGCPSVQLAETIVSGMVMVTEEMPAIG